MKRFGFIFVIVLTAVCLIGISDTLAARKYKYITIGTATIGGTFYPLGGGMADVLTKKLSPVVGHRVTASIQATGGSAENVRLIDRKRVEFALCNGSSAFEGYNGVGIYESKKKLAAMFAIYPSPVQIVTLQDSGISNILDIKGKRVALGPPGSGTENDARNICKVLNISYGDFKPTYLSFNEMAMSIRDNVIDVAFHTVGIPASSLVDLSTTRKIRIIEFTPDQLNTIKNAFPFYFGFDVPAKAYRGIEKPVRTIMTPVIMICQPEMPADLVYHVTKVLIENQKALVEVHASAKWMVRDFLTQVPIPVHPGAERYLKEIGVMKR